MRANSPWSHAELNVRQHFALDPLQIGQRRQKYERNQTCLNQTQDVKIHLLFYALRAAFYGVLSPDSNSLPGRSITELSILE